MPNAPDPEQLRRWRLILGKTAEESLHGMGCRHGLFGPGQPLLAGDQAEADEALETIYPSDEELSREEWEASTEGRKHGYVRGKSFPRVARWLDQIRTFFPADVVVLLQRDAIERRGMKELLFEPELLANVEPSIDLASTILALKNMVPEKAKAAARDVVRRVVEDVRKRLESQFVRALRGAIDRNHHSPFRSLPNLDWPPASATISGTPQPRAAGADSRNDVVLQQAQPAKSLEHHYCDGPVRLDGRFAHLRRHHGGDPGEHPGRGNARRRL